MSEPEKKVRPEDRPFCLVLALSMYPTVEQMPEGRPGDIGIVFPMEVSPGVIQDDDKSRDFVLRTIFDGFLRDVKVPCPESDPPDLWVHAIRQLKERRAVLDAPPLEKAGVPAETLCTLTYPGEKITDDQAEDRPGTDRVESISDFTFEEWVDMVRRGHNALRMAEDLLRVCYPISEKVVVVFEPLGVGKDKFSDRFPPSSDVDLGTKVVNDHGTEVKASDLTVPELAKIAAVQKMIEDWRIGRGPLSQAEPVSYHVQTDSQG